MFAKQENPSDTKHVLVNNNFVCHYHYTAPLYYISHFQAVFMHSLTQIVAYVGV